ASPPKKPPGGGRGAAASREGSRSCASTSASTDPRSTSSGPPTRAAYATLPEGPTVIHENLGTEVEMFAPNGSRITAILDKGECAYHSRFALVETPDGAYTVEREIHESQFFDEDAGPSLRLGRRL